MSGFKLIAIRPLQGIDYYTRNNLSHREIYSFYNNYDFTFDENDEDKDIISVEHVPNSTPDLYSIYSDGRKIDVNVSALVGMNGSGKSSLLELVYALCFILSRDEPSMIETSTRYQGKHVYLERSINDLSIGLKVEVFFEIDNVVRSIKYDGQNIEYSLFEPERKESDYVDASQFFYSIAVNYSLYGLNEQQHPYLHLLFHKNDGYQSPLVINPMRDDGNINVNNEFELSQARVLLNLANIDQESIEIVKSKFVSSIKFKLFPNVLMEVGTSEGVYSLQKLIDEYQKDHDQSVYQLVNTLLNMIYGADYILVPDVIGDYLGLDRTGMNSFVQYEINNSRSKQVESSRLNYLLIKYIIKKIFKIAFNYSGVKEKYTNLDELQSKPNQVPTIRKERQELFINFLLDDKSHITFKLKQAIFMFVNNTLNKFQWARHVYEPKNVEETLDERNVNALYDFYYAGQVRLSKFQNKKQIKPKIKDYFSDIHTVPGAFVKPSIEYSLDDGNDSPTLMMSSGEQQFFQSLNSILYHLRNLDSVEGSTLEGIKVYKNINLILDEIELYYHPEYQRSYLCELLRNIKQLKLKSIDSINILFSTHSPFILSDIPSSNVLRMNDGLKDNTTDFDETFGANIHNLLAHDFFLKNGFMGMYAQSRINSLIDFLSSKDLETDQWDQKMSLDFIELIGEPLLRYELKELFLSKFSNEQDIDREIKKLQKLKAQMRESNDSN